jgi:hypothetical protein
MQGRHIVSVGMSLSQKQLRSIVEVVSVWSAEKNKGGFIVTYEEVNIAVARKLGHNDAPGMGFPYSTDYCHDIKAAWELTEKIPHCTLYRGGDIWWKCSWLQTDGSSTTPWVHADTAPMAICLAFLKLP